MIPNKTNTAITFDKVSSILAPNRWFIRKIDNTGTPIITINTAI